MNELKYKEFMTRYKQFKNNNLPEPFWDEERQVKEYVYYAPDRFSNVNDEEHNYVIFNNLSDSLGEIAGASFYYSFTSGAFVYNRDNDGKENGKVEVGHQHAHSFEEVVHSLYSFPESFNISSEEEIYFSQQELEYLKRVQKYLLFIGMKDFKFEDFDDETGKIKDNIKRYYNERQEKYKNVGVIKCSDENLLKITEGKRNYFVIVPYDTSIYNDYEDFSDRYALVIDSNFDYRLYIKYTHGIIKQYIDVKEEIEIPDLKDEDKVFVEYFEIVERF